MSQIVRSDHTSGVSVLIVYRPWVDVGIKADKIIGLFEKNIFR